MPSLSVTIQQTEEILDEVLRIVRHEYENENSVLSETDRNVFVEEEDSLRKRLKETGESESNSWRVQSLLGLPSPQAAKCLEEAEDLRRRAKDDIHAKWRTRLTAGKSNALGLSFNSVGTRTPETDTPADGNPGRASTNILSPLNMPRCSVSEVSESNIGVDHAAQNDRDYSSDLNEAINTPLGTSIDRRSDSSTPRRRRSPPPPPPPRRITLSSNSRNLSETTGNSGTHSPRRSPSIRRPAPPPPQSPPSSRQSRIPRSPINISFPPSSAQGPLDPAMLSSITDFAQQMNTLASSITRQAHGRQGLRCSDRDYVTKTNCVDINRSNVKGLTLNNGGSNNSGAVIHETVLSRRSPQYVPHV